MHPKDSKNATLIICEHKNNFRALKEMEGSGSKYIPGSKEKSSRVKVIKASDESIKAELASINVIIEDPDTIRKVAEKFYSEIVSRDGGKIAWDEDTHLGFFEIVTN